MTDTEKIEKLEKKVSELQTEVNRLTNPYESNRYDEDDEDWDDEDYDEDLEMERIEERRQEELEERAATCVCGAWVFGKDGGVYHVSDCYCGAE